MIRYTNVKFQNEKGETVGRVYTRDDLPLDAKNVFSLTVDSQGQTLYVAIVDTDEAARIVRKLYPQTSVVDLGLVSPCKKYINPSCFILCKIFFQL